MTNHFEELLAIEAELTDEYVRGDLVGRRRERYEKHLLSTLEGKDDIEFARLITASSATAHKPQPIIDSQAIQLATRICVAGLWRPAFQMSLAALALIFLAVGSWLFWSSRSDTTAQSKQFKSQYLLV